MRKIKKFTKRKKNVLKPQ